MTTSSTSAANIAEPDAYMPALPEGFYWKIETRQFGNTKWEITTVFLMEKDGSGGKIVKQADLSYWGQVIQDPSEQDLRSYADDLLERYDTREALGLIP